MSLYIYFIQPKKDVYARTELHGIRGHRKVTLDANPGHRSIQQTNSDASGTWEWQRRRREAWMESADTDDKIRIVTEGHEQPHLAIDCQKNDARFEQGRVEIHSLAIKLDGAREVDLQNYERDFVGRYRDLQNAEDGNVAGNFDNDPQRDR